MTGCGSAGVNASPYDKKLSVSPSVPQWAMDVSFFFPITRTPLTTRTHFKSVYETDSGWFAAVSCGASSGISYPVPPVHEPPTLADLVWTKLDSFSVWRERKMLPTHNDSCFFYKVQKVIFLSPCNSSWNMWLLWEMGTYVNKSVPPACIHLVILGGMLWWMAFFVCTAVCHMCRCPALV